MLLLIVIIVVVLAIFSTLTILLLNRLFYYINKLINSILERTKLVKKVQPISSTDRAENEGKIDKEIPVTTKIKTSLEVTATDKQSVTTSPSDFKKIKRVEKLVLILSPIIAICLAFIGITGNLKFTVLDRSFVIDQLNKLDLQAAGQEFLKNQFPTGSSPYSDQTISATIVDLAPWLKQLALDITNQVYDFVLGNSTNLNFSTSLEQLQTDLKQNLQKAVLQNPPPDLTGASPATIQSYVDTTDLKLFGKVPGTLELSRTATPDIFNDVATARTVISIILVGFWILLGVVLSLIATEIFASKERKFVARKLGVGFLTGAALGYGYAFLMGQGLNYAASLNLLASIQGWIITVVGDVVATFKGPNTFIFIGVGIVLFIASFIIRSKQSVKVPDISNAPV